MPRVPLQIGAQSGQAQSTAVSVERLVNGYVEQTPQGREPAPVYGTPGLIEFAALGTVRAMCQAKDRLFVVTDKLYEVFSDGTSDELGTVPGGTVDIASDGNYTVLTVGNAIYVQQGVNFAQVTDLDAPDASSVELMNGFFLFTETNTQAFFIAPQGNPGGDYDALDFDSSDVLPDNLVRIRRIGRTLAMMGKQSIEFWYYSGDEVFPFARYQDDPIDVGLIGVRAEASTNETLFWLASDKTVRRLDGRTATRISTFAVETEIAGWSDPSLTVATAHVYQGHLFVVFRNPDGCVVWDQATQRWHERQSYEQDSWRVSHYAYAFGTHLFGGAKLYELGGYDEDGSPLVMEMVTPWVDNQGQRFSITEVEVRMEAGTGGPVENPAITLERTEDGSSFSTALTRYFGLQGERFRLVKFSRQGMSRGCAFRLKISDAVKRVIYAIYAEVV